ncbi:MAG: YjgP/YjgQ family permease [Acidimicrobiales bacterium]|nr:YjgP/YjgQ family permease [Hyphomonadaceae bacterium]RZV43733.1 MAG: YjgP/YjgQ family permease [Acidimicrobiales bacterium]
MIRLSIYMIKTFVLSWLTVTFGFLVLVGLFDALANGGEIISGDRGFIATFEYMIYRAPVIFDRVLLFTVMVAMLLTYVKLIRQHELVSLLGFGLSVPRQIAMLTPAVVGVTMLSITFINTAMPPAVRSLQAWGIGEYKRTSISEEKPLWLQDGNRIIKAAGRPNMRTLTNLQFFDQEENGDISIISWIDRADYSPDGWVLKGVSRLATGDRFTPAPLSVWSTEQNPESIAKLAADPRDLSLKDMRLFRIEGNSGSKPSFAYGFWHLHRLTRPLAAFVLLMCAVPIMQRTGREESGDTALIIGIISGFVYLIIDGGLSTFAVSGTLPIGWAVGFPIALFALIGGFLCLKSESLRL